MVVVIDGKAKAVSVTDAVKDAAERWSVKPAKSPVWLWSSSVTTLQATPT